MADDKIRSGAGAAVKLEREIIVFPCLTFEFNGIGAARGYRNMKSQKKSYIQSASMTHQNRPVLLLAIKA